MFISHPWSLSHSCEYFPSHWLRRKLHYGVKGVRESVLHLPGTCNKTSYSLLLCERFLYTPTENVAVVFLQVQPCLKLFAFNISSCFFNNIPLVYQLFTLISLTTKSKPQKVSKLTWFILFYTDLCLKTTYQYANQINMKKLLPVSNSLCWIPKDDFHAMLYMDVTSLELCGTQSMWTSMMDSPSCGFHLPIIANKT